MEERALSFLGTKSTERFTKKRCCVTLIQVKVKKGQKFEYQPPQEASVIHGNTAMPCSCYKCQWGTCFAEEFTLLWKNLISFRTSSAMGPHIYSPGSH